MPDQNQTTDVTPKVTKAELRKRVAQSEYYLGEWRKIAQKRSIQVVDRDSLLSDVRAERDALLEELAGLRAVRPHVTYSYSVPIRGAEAQMDRLKRTNGVLGDALAAVRAERDECLTTIAALRTQRDDERSRLMRALWDIRICAEHAQEPEVKP